jgi:Zn-dependent protease
MKWSWKIARIAGIDVYIHATFFILVAWFGYHYWTAQGTLAAALEGMAYIIALFTCVVLHEFGHALTAKRYGIVTSNITLLPIGGVASMERLPENPLEEIKVALAGPLVNVVIASVLYLWLNVNGVHVDGEEFATTGGPFLYRLMIVNIFLALFNLLPAFPMDGGRVLRAAMAIRMPHHLATKRAAAVGQCFAVFFGMVGFSYGNPFLMLIAVFLWVGAGAENQSEQMKNSLAGATASDAMLTEFHVLAPEDTLTKAIHYTLAGSQKDFPVGNQHQIIGVLTQKYLLEALQQYGENFEVGKLNLSPIKTIEKHTPIQQLLDEIQIDKNHMLAVNDANKIVGIINLENIIELINIQTALNDKKSISA